MIPVTPQLVGALVDLGLKAFERYHAARGIDTASLSAAELLDAVQSISLGDVDALLAEGEASAPTG